MLVFYLNSLQTFSYISGYIDSRNKIKDILKNCTDRAWPKHIKLLL